MTCFKKENSSSEKILKKFDYWRRPDCYRAGLQDEYSGVQACKALRRGYKVVL